MSTPTDSRTRLGTITAAYMKDQEASRNKWRADIISMHLEKADLHSMAAALEQENDELREKLADTKIRIQDMEKSLKERNSDRSNANSAGENQVVLTPQPKVNANRAQSQQLGSPSGEKSKQTQKKRVLPADIISEEEEEDEEEEPMQLQQQKKSKQITSSTYTTPTKNSRRMFYVHSSVTKKRQQGEATSETADENAPSEGSVKRRKVQIDSEASASSSHQNEPGFLKPRVISPHKKPTTSEQSRNEKPKENRNKHSDCITIDASAVASILRHCVKIPDVSPKVTTSRCQLMDAYGGGKTSFLQAYPLKYPSIRLNIKSVPGASQTKQRIFVFPNAAPELNAHFPARPGAHGLMFGMKPQIESLLKDDDSVVCELFAAAPEIRFTTAVSKSIEYYGTYRISETRPMTAEEFKAQSKTIQEAIALEIIDAGPGGTIRYLQIKARAAYRRKGREIKRNKSWPTENFEQKRFLHEVGKGMEEEDIIKNLANGNEKLPILILECIKYDKDLAKSIVSATANTV